MQTVDRLVAALDPVGPGVCVGVLSSEVETTEDVHVERDIFDERCPIVNAR